MYNDAFVISTETLTEVRTEKTKKLNYEKLVKIIENNNARLILHRNLNGATT